MSNAQLRAAGLDAFAVARRVAAGRLHPLGRGVFAVGHLAVTPDGRLFAAVLGTGGVISHRSAAAMWGFGKPPTRVDVLVTERGRTPWDPVHLHKTRDLRLTDLSECRGIPVTSVPRTLVDLAAVVSVRTLKRAFHEAEVVRLLDVAAVEEILERSNGRRGVGHLRRLLSVPAAPTRTELEARFLELLGEEGVPLPAVNVMVHDFEVDFFWSRERLAVEVDGGHVHNTRRGFERDRRRDIELAKRGVQTARFTWRRVVDEPRTVAQDVVELRALRAGVQDRSRGAL